MKTLFGVVSALSLAAAAAPAPQPSAPAAPKPLTPEETKKAMYAMGTFIALRTPLSLIELTEDELALVMSGFSDVVQKKPLSTTPESMMNKMDQLMKEKSELKMASSKKRADAYMATAGEGKGQTKLDSGVLYKELTAGTGAQPTAKDTVKVHYRGSLVDGTEFDSSYSRNQPAEFPLDRVIRCWTEGVARMKVGGKAELTCPPDTAYGEQVKPKIPPNSVLKFEVELLGITTPPAADGGTP